mgnify:CR=1 FL=1|jgi:alpha-beta hydrolase superfamily lysophospholipase
MQSLQTDDQLPLHLRQWEAGPAARGSVLLVHGLGEHVGRYAAVADTLNRAGWTVWGYDHRGHGASGGARGALATDDSLLRDLSRVVDALRVREPGAVVLLGHSMGGAIAARFVAEGLQPQPASWWRPVDALALSSPALDIGLNPGQRLLLTVLGRLAPNLALANGLDPAWVSRDVAVVQAYRDDPLVHDRITPRLVRFMDDAGAFVRARAAHWRVPTLLQWAGADRCVRPAGSAAFAATAPASVVQHRTYPALAHEIFNEPEREQVLAELTQWLARGATAG